MDEMFLKLWVEGFPLWAELLLAFALDFALGDPPGFLHPVVWIGKWIGFLERRLRAFTQKRGSLDHRADEKRAGIVLCVATSLLFGAAAWAVPFVLGQTLGPFAASIGRVILMALALAARSLARAAKRVCAALDADDVKQARESVGHLVGRDVDKLTAQGVARAACESVAENTTDGVIAPLFYMAMGAFLFGSTAIGSCSAVFVWLYKAGSTLDSMVGYQNERYQYFGWCSAKWDDILAYLPARLTALLMCAASFVLRLNWRSALHGAIHEHGRHASPNSGWPEAAAAGAVGIRMGGGAYYGGVLKKAPSIGFERQAPSALQIKQCVRLMWFSAVLCAVLGAFLPLSLPWLAVITAIACMAAPVLSTFIGRRR